MKILRNPSLPSSSWGSYVTKAPGPETMEKRQKRDLLEWRSNLVCLDTIRGLERALTLTTGEGIAQAKPTHPAAPGTDTILDPPNTRHRRKLLIRSDCGSVGLSPVFYLMYGPNKIRGFHRSDPLHDLRNMAWNAFQDGGMTSPGLN